MLLACQTWSGAAFSNMNDVATQEKSEKKTHGPVVAAADAEAVAI